jgi:hypothetical protein
MARFKAIYKNKRQRKGSGGGLLGYFFGGNGGMALIVNAFAISDDQYLRRFVVYAELFGYLCRQRPVVEQVEKIKINGFRRGGTLEPAEYGRADTAAGTVFENNLWPGK